MFHSCTPDRISTVFLNVISHTRTSSWEREKTNSGTPAACWPHVNLWCHCNVKITSPCRFFLEIFFMFFQYIMRYLVVSKKKNPLFVWGWDRNICPSWSLFVITRQASWCQLVILWTDFSIPPSHSWWILIIYHFVHNAKTAFGYF